MKSKRILIYLGILVSFVAIFYSVKGLDWQAVPGAFSKANPLFILLLIPQFYFMYFIRTWRWQKLLSSSNFKQAFDATMLGFFATSILPLRAGEFIRPWIFSKWSNIALLTCFASIVVERVFDVLALMVIISVCFCLIDLPPELSILVTGAKALSLIALAISFLMLVAYLRSAWIEKTVSFFCKLCLEKKWDHLARKVKKLAFDFVEGLKIINSVKAFFQVSASSILLWLIMSFYYQLAIWAFDPEASILVGFTVNSIVALAVAAPSAPGFIGTFQLGCLLALKNIFGYSQELAIAYSIIVHLSQYILTISHGLYILNQQGMKLSEINNLNQSMA